MQQVYPWLAWIGGGIALYLGLLTFLMFGGSWDARGAIERFGFCFFWGMVYLILFVRWIFWG